MKSKIGLLGLVQFPQKTAGTTFRGIYLGSQGQLTLAITKPEEAFIVVRTIDSVLR